MFVKGMGKPEGCLAAVNRRHNEPLASLQDACNRGGVLEAGADEVGEAPVRVHALPERAEYHLRDLAAAPLYDSLCCFQKDLHHVVVLVYDSPHLAESPQRLLPLTYPPLTLDLLLNDNEFGGLHQERRVERSVGEAGCGSGGVGGYG